MKKFINKKRVLKITFRVIISILLCAVVLIIPTIGFGEKLSIKNKFTSNRSEYQGVLEVWHIDTFEGGTLGKYQFLKARAIDFEKQNKGLYFMIKNMTENQCLLALKSGQTPAMFSFGVGVGEQILEYLAELNISNLNMREEFLEAGKSGGNMYASAWCRGVYSLITTTKRLELAKQAQTTDLASIAISCGYTKALKNNKTKTTYSLAFGSAGYVCPQLAYKHSYKNLVQNATSISLDNITKTPYSAYCDFVEGKANILLGTQRDIARIENRISVGKIDGVIYQHLTEYTDLVQYLGVVNKQDKKITACCTKFIEFMASDFVQQKLSNIGMFSVNNNISVYTSGVWQDIEKLAQNPCTVENAFTNFSTLKANKQACIDVQQV